MSQVLDIDSLLESPLADLHALAGELGIESYRLMRKPDLTVAILVNRGQDEGSVRPEIEKKYAEIQRLAAEQLAALDAADEAAEQERNEKAQAAREQRSQAGRSTSAGGQGRSRQAGGQRGGRGRGAGAQGEGRQGEGRQQRARGGDGKQSEQRQPRGREGAQSQGAPQQPESGERKPQTFAVSGVFEPRQGGGGMVRPKLAGRSKEDVEVSRNDARKWRLFNGDMVAGEAKKSRRGRGAGLLSSVTTINGVPLDKISSGERAKFDEAATTAASGQLARKLFKHAKFGNGSRTLVVGSARGASSELMRELASQLSKDGLVTALIAVAAPPEAAEAAAGASYDFVAGSPTGKTDEVLGGAELAIERGKRLAEAGKDAVVLIDGIDLLPEQRARELFATARNLKELGSLTVVGAAAQGSVFEALATTIAIVAVGRKVKVDKKLSWSSF
ncbi:MAG: Rho termination factor N-terminal domain-containing protein [Thermoleophilaceae bacterium]|nr:Rho termination factor N-terminal domain-containing protein [Thermoleophilaceae bacterium]